MAGNKNTPETAGSRTIFSTTNRLIPGRTRLSAVTALPRRTVLTYGTFDQFLPEHVRLLQTLSRLGQELVVGCTTDALCAQRGLQPVMPFAQRRRLLESCRLVSRVITEETPEQKRTDIVNYNVSVFAMGAACQGQFDELEDITQVIYLPMVPAEPTASRMANAI